MDILIKSFNRPYYLDRCIQSIYLNVLDADFAIKILDDGTPAKYLEKIKSKYPNVQIYKSQFYDEKSSKIKQNKQLENTKIPIDLWLKAARDTTNYFLLLEDDIWLTKKINLAETSDILERSEVCCLKLFWLNNAKLIHGKDLKSEGKILLYKPAVFTKHPLLYRLIFGITRFNNRKMMQFLNLYSKNRALQYYSLYSVAGAIFEKEYFLRLWDNHDNLVDENLQLRNAVKFWHSNRHVHFARTNTEMAGTGFSSSATNKSFGIRNFDIFTFNQILNDAWFSDQIDVMKNFPQDLNHLIIESILVKEDHLQSKANDWNLWVSCFKNQFQKIGCNI